MTILIALQLLALSETTTAALFGLISTTLLVLGGIVVELLRTSRKASSAVAAAAESHKMVIEIHNMVNSQRTAMEKRIGELASVIIEAGLQVPAPPDGEQG